MVKFDTILENGTGSLFEVRSESSSGVHALLTTLKPQGTYRLSRSSSDTYLLHWVVIGDAHIVSFSSDELIDNQRIKIICEGGTSYKKVLIPRNTARSNSTPNPILEINGEESPTHALSTSGKPPLSSFKRFFSALIRRSNSSEEAASSSLGFDRSSSML